MPSELTCEHCDRTFKSQSGLDRHVEAQHPPEVFGDVAAATERSIKAATHLTDMEAGPLAVIRRLARTIDGMDSRPDDAPLDNVTVPTYLKYAADLGLTPAGRVKLDQKKPSGTSKLGQLRSVSGGRAS